MPDLSFAFGSVIDKMKVLRRILKIAACIFGSVVAASLLFIAATLIIFGRDFDRQTRLIEQWIPFVWGCGAVCGGLIAYRSERSRVRRV
jgi:hypothetical protein